jgi:hypothetical protein
MENILMLIFVLFLGVCIGIGSIFAILYACWIQD